MTANLINEQLKNLPNTPGVYMLKDAEGNILYVGKAANLRHRVSSYFGSPQKLSPKLQKMVSQVSDIDFVITSSEQEALIFELNLIKEHRPRYNVRLKDDKTFPYLKIDLRDEWPRIYMTRRLERDGGYYFGPFASAKSVRQTIRVMKEIFPFRSCTKPINGADARACLEYHIGRCLGPCTGTVTKGEHSRLIRQVINFLEGKQEKVLRELQERMNQASEALEFEKAALMRDRIQAIQKVIEGQKIAATVKGNQDVIAFARDNDQAYAQVFFIRSGKLIGRESFVLQGTHSEEPQEIMTSFIKQFYNSAPNIPPLIMLQYPVQDAETIEAWLEGRRGGGVRIETPSRGNKKQLVDIVAENARRALEHLKVKQFSTQEAISAALDEIQRELRLPHTPHRIEGYDISNIRGTAAVGSMVVFEKGKPKPAHYRRFRIKTISGANDYAMLQEVLRRRFKRAGEAADRWQTPDLILIDGGKGQLSAARQILEEMGGDVSVASLAKENEEIFIPGEAKPVVLPRSSPGLQMLQRVRDESHRFALGYYQKVRKRESFASALDEIPGIGSKRKRALLRRFGSLRAIAEANVEEIAAAEGMTRRMAERVKEYLR